MAIFRTYDVYLVKDRNGKWSHRTYRVEHRKRVEPLPKTLEKRFVRRVNGCRYRIDAERAGITKTLGD